LPRALAFVEVLEGRAARDAREQARERVPDGARLELRPAFVRSPVEKRRSGEILTPSREVVSLAEQVGEREAEVEGGIAEVDDLVVEEHEPLQGLSPTSRGQSLWVVADEH